MVWTPKNNEAGIDNANEIALAPEYHILTGNLDRYDVKNMRSENLAAS